VGGAWVWFPNIFNVSFKLMWFGACWVVICWYVKWVGPWGWSIL